MGKPITAQEAADQLGLLPEELRSLVAHKRIATKLFETETQRTIRRFDSDDVEALRIDLECDRRRLATVYVVGFDRFAKIGWTTNFERRFEALSLSLPLPLEKFAAFPGTPKSERDLHARFMEHRTRGEWFLNEGKLAEWISEGCPHDGR